MNLDSDLSKVSYWAHGMQAVSRSERRKARTTAAILDAAERHFLERGFQSAKVDEIAEEADVAVGSVYNHFGSKDGLYGALLERALRPVRDLHGRWRAARRFRRSNGCLTLPVAWRASAANDRDT